MVAGAAVEERKWPVPAQIILALGCLAGVGGVVGGLLRGSIPGVLVSLALFIIYWGAYMFQRWAWRAISILIVINIAGMLAGLLFDSGMSVNIVTVGVVVIALAVNALLLWYFNSRGIRALFECQKLPDTGCAEG